MRTSRIRFLTVLIVSFVVSVSVRAAYDDVGVSARVTGLGDAFTGVADDVYSVYYNPAGLGTLERPELGTSYSKLLTGLSDNSNLQNSFLAYAHPLKYGRWGTVGGAWNYFTLDSLYREMSFYGSYGREVAPGRIPKALYAGASLKILNRSLGSTDAAVNPLGPTGAVVPGTDPVLENASRTNLDMDLGLLWRVRPRWSLGLMVGHLFEPNIAFSSADTDRLGRNVKLGGSYKTAFSLFTGEAALRKAPDGSTDKAFTLAAEKWLPTLLHGTFGARGSIGVGDRDYRQLAAGVSYKIYRMQFDYGFSIPLGGISGTYGTHRLGVTFRFGKPKSGEPTIGEAMLEGLLDLSEVGTPEFRYQAEELALFKRTAVESYLRQAQVEAGAGNFAESLDRVNQALSIKPKDEKLMGSQERLKIVAEVLPEVREFTSNAAQAALYEGILDFLVGRDLEALRRIDYAQSFKPEDERIERLLKGVEAKSGLSRKAPAQVEAETEKAEAAKREFEALVDQMEGTLRERQYDTVLRLAGVVLDRDPANALAYKRMGTAYYAMGRYPEAIRALRSAHDREKDPETRTKLSSYVAAIQNLVEKRAAEEAAAAQRAEPVKPAKTPQELESLYEAGVELYAQGRLQEASEMFRKILEAEPANAQARRALDRVQAEILRARQGR